jgi:hypothetical protein
MLSADGNKPTGKPGQGKRKGNGKKSEARKRKVVQEAAHQQEPNPDPLQDTPEAISAPLTSAEDALIDSSANIESSPLAAETADETVTSTQEALTDDSSIEAAPVSPEAAVPPVVSDQVSPTGLASIDWSPAASSEAAPAVPVEAAPAASAEIVPSEPAQTAAVSYQTIASAYGDLTRRSFDQTTSFFEKFWGVRSFDKAFELQTEFARQAYDSFVEESHRIRELHHEMTRQRLQRWEGFVGMTKPPR